MIQQAIFTSIRGDRVEGYQLATRSPGLDSADAQELARWSPAHGALLDSWEDAASLNFHWLESGRFCISRTRAAGSEYSERGGVRLATQLLVCESNVLERFGSNPFLVLDAVLAAGALIDSPELPDSLPAIELNGRASAVENWHLTRLLAEFSPKTLAAIAEAALTAPALAMPYAAPMEDLLRGLFSLLPQEARLGLSFTTGLRHSAARQFRLFRLPKAPAEQRQTLRQTGATLFRFDQKCEFEAGQPWSLQIEQALSERRFHRLAEQVALSSS